MTREEIIQLARHCNQDSIRATKNRPYGIYELTEDAIIAFYKAAQAEAFEAAENALNTDKYPNECDRSIIWSFKLAIREMAKEMK